jgi:squalene-associated FAD-dependent desaturase
MDQRVAIIGAGYAGLACAVELARRGVAVEVFERSGTLGGRARVVDKDGWRVDNGQHILLGAYGELARLLRLVGVAPRALARLPLTLHMPGRLEFTAAGLPAPWHLALGLLRARGLSWADRRAAFGLLSWLKARKFRLGQDMPVSSLLIQTGQTETLCRRLWEPLCVAALNTPPQRASAQIFANVLKDSLAAHASASEMLLPRTDLSELFPVPAVRYLATRRGIVNSSNAIAAIECGEDGMRLEGDWTGRHYPHVVVATAPYHAAPLLASTGRCARLADLLGGLEHEPITTIYLAYPAGVRLPGPIVALPDPTPQAPGQWAFDHGQIGSGNGNDTHEGNLIAVVISAGGPHEQMSRDALIVAAHGQLEALLERRLPAPGWSQAIVEKRATFSCTPGLLRPAHRTPVAGLWLAGDYVDSPYPATLESAVTSGVRCALAIAGALGRTLPAWLDIA